MVKPDSYVKQILKDVDNSKEVFGVWNDQAQVKSDLNDDAMDEILPYLQQGV